MDNIKKKILIIEDDPDVLDFIIMAFEEIGMAADIHTASDNHAIMQAISTLLPDMIILDLMMPGTTGFIICQKYRSREGTAHTKILAITGYDTPENKQRILECGANDYLPKPFSFDAIKEKIAFFLG